MTFFREDELSSVTDDFGANMMWCIEIFWNMTSEEVSLYMKDRWIFAGGP